jgi:hypothetical protein
MIRLFRNPLPRAVAINLILVAQLQLLWVAAVHQHGALLASSSVTLESSNPAQGPTSAGAEVQCLACHLIHHNAARASVAVSAILPTVSERCPLAASSDDFHSCDLPLLHGRAPPQS